MENDFLKIFKEALELEDENVSIDDRIKDYDNWDSISKLSLIALLDEHYEIGISNSELDNLDTISDLYDLVKNKLDNG
jgi:acyl carrier protein